MAENEEKDINKKTGCCCGNECTCGDNCTCDESCACGCQDGEPCTCGCECHCEDDCDCGCHCDESCDCGCQEGKPCTCNEEKDKYLNLAKQVQADFDNFRRHSREEVEKARIYGQVSVIEAFLPCLDTFKEAKKHISDESVLEGVTMIENKILDTLKTLGVEKIEAIGEKYNPHLHNAIAVMKDEEKENDIILEEYQAGYKYKEKVIRYSKVIVNKKED